MSPVVLFKERSGNPTHIAFSADGQWVAGADGDAIRVFDAQTLALNRILVHPKKQAIRQFVFLRQQRLVLANSSDSEIVGISDDRVPSIQFPLESPATRMLQCGQDDQIAIALSDDSIRLFNTRMARTKKVFQSKVALKAIACSCDGKLLAVLDHQRQLVIIGLETELVIATLRLEASSNSLCFVSSEEICVGDDSGTLTSFAIPAMTVNWRQRFSSAINCIAYHRESNRLLIGCGDQIYLPSFSRGRAYLLTGGGKIERSFRVRGGWVHAVAISPNGTQFAASTADGTVSVWATTR